MAEDSGKGRQGDSSRILADDHVQDLFQELRGKVRYAFSPTMLTHTRGRRLKAGPFRRSPVEIRIPVLSHHPAPYLFRPDQLASILTLSDRMVRGHRLRRILLLPEFYQVDGQVLAAALPESDTLVFYLCPLRLFLERPEARSIWGIGDADGTGDGQDAVFEALFRFLESSVALAPEGALFLVPSVTEGEMRDMQQIHDRFVLHHPMHVAADGAILPGETDAFA